MTGMNNINMEAEYNGGPGAGLPDKDTEPESDLQKIINEYETETETESKAVSESETETVASSETAPQDTGSTSFPVCIGAGIVSGILTAVIVFVLLRIWMKRNVSGRRDQSDLGNTENNIAIDQNTGFTEKDTAVTGEQQKANAVGRVHHIGSRRSQQDSLGMTETDGGYFAVVADGMGGLSDGDKVSQKIVMTMLKDAVLPKLQSKPYILYEMTAHASRVVNQMLGPKQQYRSGSTMIAALVEKNCFRWVSVGDSRIYLFRGQQLLKLNREHNYEAELLQDAVNGACSFRDVQTHPKRQGLTSFIGMGELKYVDGSPEKIISQKGDILLLMSDGVYNTLSEEEMCRMLIQAKNAAEAAKLFEAAILSHQKKNQDNFTAIIIDLQSVN